MISKDSTSSPNNTIGGRFLSSLNIVFNNPTMPYLLPKAIIPESTATTRIHLLYSPTANH